MFQSEQLQEKWAPLLNHEGLDKIENNHKRAVTAVLLENQEKFLREQQAFASSGSLFDSSNQVFLVQLLLQEDKCFSSSQTTWRRRQLIDSQCFT